MPTCFGVIHRIESDPNCNFSRLYSLTVGQHFSKSQVWGEIQDRVTHISDSYTVERFETVSTPTLTEIHIRRTLPLDWGLNYGFWMRIEAGIEAFPNTVKGIYPQL